MKRTPIALGLALMLLLLVGCGAATTPATTTTATTTATATTTTTASTLCQRMQPINQALAQLAGVGDNTTVGDIKAAQQKLTTALNALSLIPASEGSALTDLKAANDQLAAEIKDLPDSATVGEVGPRLQNFKANVTKAQTAATKLTSLLKCNG